MLVYAFEGVSPAEMITTGADVAEKQTLESHIGRYHVAKHRDTKFVRVPVLPVPVICASRTLGTGQTRFFEPPRYPEDWRDSVCSAPQVPSGLAGFGHFSPRGTFGTGVT